MYVPVTHLSQIVPLSRQSHENQKPNQKSNLLNTTTI